MPKGRRKSAIAYLLLQCFLDLGGLPTHGASNGTVEGAAEELQPAAEWNPHPYCTRPADRDSVHLSPLCGTWQREYGRVHAAALAANASKEQRKFLVYSCDYKRQRACGGLGDRMLGMLTTFMIAALTGRAFLNDQPPDFDTVYEPVGVDWRLPPGVALLPAVLNPEGGCAFGYKKGRRPYRPGDVVELYLHDQNIRVEELERCFQVLGGVQTVVMRFNRGRTIAAVRSPGEWGQQLRAWGLREPYITGCMLRYLLRPKAEIEASVKATVDELQAPDTFSVCIHSRPGAAAVTDEQLGSGVAVGGRHFQQTENLVACAQDLSEYWSTPGQTVKWFLMASSYAAKAIIKKRDPEKVVITDWVPLHTEARRNGNQTSDLREALLLAGKEWTIFSKCHMFVFHDSGLSKTAALYAMRPLSIYMFPRARFLDKAGALKFCEPGSPTSTQSLASRLWSGA